MPIHRALLHAGLAVAAAAALAAGSAAAHDGRATPCFYLSQWQGWTSPSPSVLYLGVNSHDVYRVGLSGESYNLRSPGMHLVSINRGPSSICSAIDLDLRLADTGGFVEPLIATTLTKLTPEEVAAIPPKFMPGH